MANPDGRRLPPPLRRICNPADLNIGIFNAVKALIPGTIEFDARKYEYNFEMHSWGSFKEIIRNVETTFADIIHGQGANYYIKFKGVNTIHHNWFVPLIKKVL